MIVTFYSFKGGVGRSMALANVAELLAQWGYSVIVCDWDLEAPGLERYLEDKEERITEFRAKPGIIDLVSEYKDALAHPMAAANAAARRAPVPDGFEAVGDCILRQPHTWALPLVRDTAKTRGSIRLLPAGRRDAEWAGRYDRAVTGMDWADFYEKWAGGSYFEFFREDVNANADLVLIDSRTGVTELGGICTQHLADMVLVFTTANDQSLEGAKRMVSSLERPEVTEYRNGRLLGILPIASRVDTRSEVNEVLEFKRRFTQAFGEVVARNARRESRFLELSLIPYVGLYSYVERSVARLPEEDRDLDLIKPYYAISEALVEWGVEHATLKKIEVSADSAARVVLDVLATERRYARPAAPRGEYYLAWAPGEQERAAALANSLRESGLNVWCDALPRRGSGDIRSAANRLGVIGRSAGYILLVPNDFDTLWLEAEANAILARWATKKDYRPLVIGPEAPFQSNLQVARIPAVSARQGNMGQLAELVISTIAASRSVLEGFVEGPSLDYLPSPDETHSRFLLGRDNALRFLLAEVEEMTKIERFAMVVLGDYGCGQAELMRAGLLPSLRRGLVGPDRRSWRVAYVWLKEEPAREVLSALAQVTGMPVEKGTPADVGEVLRWIERNSDSVALVIDNCERLTREGWQDKRAALFDLIGKLRAAPAGRFFLVISERKGKSQRVYPPEWGEVKTWELPIFDEQGVRDFLTGGAKLFGVGWEPDALDRAVSEAANLRATPQITGLILRETLSQREGRTITFKSYVLMGGVAQVIASHAGKTLSRLTSETKEAANRIILRLVSAPGRTKRSLAFNDLVAIAGAGVEDQNAIVCLLDHGILRVDAGEVYALRTSQIADVEPVRTWLEAETGSVTTTARLEQAVEEWEESKRAPSATARGAALLEFERVTPLLQKEKEFLARSREMERLAQLGQERVSTDSSRRVFLAECTPDLDSERLKMKLFLEEKGWLILPESDYDVADYEALLERDLKASLAFIQLIGPYPWQRGGLDVRQNEKAKALGIPRFRRRDPEIEMNTVAESHRTFISAPDVIASGFEDFKVYLDRELSTLWQARHPPARSHGTTIPLVYVAVRSEKPDQLWDQAYTWLQPENVLLYLLKPYDSFEEKYRVEPCHGFLILCDAAASVEGPFSPRDQIEQCRIIQMREKDPARRPPVGLVYWPPPAPVWARLLRSSALKTYRIVADAHAQLENFLAEVRNVAS